MNERFIYLIEKFFDDELTGEEQAEFNSLIENDTELKNEFDEQKKIKEVLKKMNLKNPSKEFWDGYWLSLYNRIERKIAWMAITIGAVILFFYASLKAVESFLTDTQTPVFIKYGIAILALGFVVLIISLIREKIFSLKRDKYKEIER
jgi:hypothetical protein